MPNSSQAKEVIRRVFSAAILAPRRVGIFAIRVYQRTLSRLLPAIFGPNSGCRFYPTCSHYSVEALKRHGLILGSALTLWRILRCQPWSAGGHDPVPEKLVFKPRTLRAPLSLTSCKRLVHRPHG